MVVPMSTKFSGSNPGNTGSNPVGGKIPLSSTSDVKTKTTNTADNGSLKQQANAVDVNTNIDKNGKAHVETSLGKGRALSVSWSNDGQYLAIGSSNVAYAIHNVEKLLIDKLVGDKKNGSSTTYRSILPKDINPISSTASPKPVALSTSITIGKENVHELRGHANGVEKVLWAPSVEDSQSSHVIATCSKDKTVCIFDLRESPKHSFGYRPVKSIVTSDENINMAWSPNGRYIAVGGKHDTISFIDLLASDQEMKGSLDTTNLINSRKPSENNNNTNNNNNNNNKGLYSNARVVRKINMRDIMDEEVNEIGWNNAGDLFFMTTGLGQVRIFEFSTLLQEQTTKTNEKTGEILKGSDNFLNEVTNVSITSHMATCYSIGFDPKGRYFATGGGDATVNVWDVESLLCVRALTRLESPIQSVSFSGDGELVASASEDKNIDISNIDTGALFSMISVKYPVNSISFSPSKYMIAYALDAPNVKIGICVVY